MKFKIIPAIGLFIANIAPFANAASGEASHKEQISYETLCDKALKSGLFVAHEITTSMFMDTISAHQKNGSSADFAPLTLKLSKKNHAEAIRDLFSDFIINGSKDDGLNATIRLELATDFLTILFQGKVAPETSADYRRAYPKAYDQAYKEAHHPVAEMFHIVQARNCINLSTIIGHYNLLSNALRVADRSRAPVPTATGTDDDSKQLLSDDHASGVRRRAGIITSPESAPAPTAPAAVAEDKATVAKHIAQSRGWLPCCSRSRGCTRRDIATAAAVVAIATGTAITAPGITGVAERGLAGSSLGSAAESVNELTHTIAMKYYPEIVYDASVRAEDWLRALQISGNVPDTE